MLCVMQHRWRAAALNMGTLDAGRGALGLDGLRPARAAREARSKVPNPWNVTRSPLATGHVMEPRSALSELSLLARSVASLMMSTAHALPLVTTVALPLGWTGGARRARRECGCRGGWRSWRRGEACTRLRGRRRRDADGGGDREMVGQRRRRRRGRRAFARADRVGRDEGRGGSRAGDGRGTRGELARVARSNIFWRLFHRSSPRTATTRGTSHRGKGEARVSGSRRRDGMGGSRRTCGCLARAACARRSARELGRSSGFIALDELMSWGRGRTASVNAAITTNQH